MRFAHAKNWSSCRHTGHSRTPLRCTAARVRRAARQRGDPVMAAIEDRQAARDAKLDELHEKLAGAVEELVSGDDWKRALTFAANFRSRSFNNTLLIWAQHQAAHEQGFVPDPMPTYVAGYKQWQDRPPGTEGATRVSDPRARHRPLRFCHASKCRFMEATKKVRGTSAR